MRLTDRVALVTGGTAGIGRGVALELAREGAKVVVADIQEEPNRGRYHETDTSTTTVEEIANQGGEGFFVQLDIADEGAVCDLFNSTVDRFDGLDILVNNAGIHIPGSSETLSLTDWDRVMSVNLRALFVTTKMAIPHLRESKAGRIINIASVHAFGGGAVLPMRLPRLASSI